MGAGDKLPYRKQGEPEGSWDNGAPEGLISELSSSTQEVIKRWEFKHIVGFHF